MNNPDAVALRREPRASAALPYTVSVRGLCEFTAKQGDLDLRFTPSPSSEQGIAGHRTVRSHRSDGYRSEVPVFGEYEDLAVRGRADGFDEKARVVEEIKTCVGDAASIPRNHRALHWAQAKVYGALLCRQLALPEITVALVYFDIRDQCELPRIAETYRAEDLDAYFEGLCSQFLVWARAESTHRTARDESLEQLRFPYASFRSGQRDFAKSVFNAARSKTCLLAQAPTGIGKTLGALFPMLKASRREKIDKICFLTAKGSGKALALSAMQALHRAQPALNVRTLELTAREKACEHPDKSCHPESCPLARGFYDRLPAARASAAQRPLLTQSVVREIASLNQVCPYYLAQEMTRWCDVVVADYNHYFDRSALVYELVQENGWRVALLIDEGHNLLDRARAMFSASLDSTQVRGLLPGAPYRIANSMKRLLKQWLRITRNAPPGYSVLPAPPDELHTALLDITGTMSEHFADAPSAASSELLAFYFDALALERALATFGSHSMLDLQRQGNKRRIDCRIAVRNVVPASFLESRFEAAHCAVLFSATLAPWQFYIDTLGLSASTHCVDIPSPFEAEQLRVRIVDRISTRYVDRERSIAPIAELIEHEYRRAPGNHLVFVSSFDYLDRIADDFAERCSDIPIWRQTRQMSDADRDAFLLRFEPDGQGIGFAVLGGIFAEGIDLVGSRLVGVFIATLGLPQVNEVNEEMRRRLDELFGSGYDYTYLYPGLRKVVQAAGRVIRTESDRGSVWLIDDRYARSEVRRLLPAWWQLGSPRARPAIPNLATTRNY